MWYVFLLVFSYCFHETTCAYGGIVSFLGSVSAFLSNGLQKAHVHDLKTLFEQRSMPFHALDAIVLSVNLSMFFMLMFAW